MAAKAFEEILRLETSFEGSIIRSYSRISTGNRKNLSPQWLFVRSDMSAEVSVDGSAECRESCLSTIDRSIRHIRSGESNGSQNASLMQWSSGKNLGRDFHPLMGRNYKTPPNRDPSQEAKDYQVKRRKNGSESGHQSCWGNWQC